MTPTPDTPSRVEAPDRPMTEQPVDLEALEAGFRRCGCEDCVGGIAVIAELRALRADLDKARADLGEAVKVVRVFLGHDDRFQVGVGGNPIAVDRMLDAARALLSRLEGER